MCNPSDSGKEIQLKTIDWPGLRATINSIIDLPDPSPNGDPGSSQGGELTKNAVSFIEYSTAVFAIHALSRKLYQIVTKMITADIPFQESQGETEKELIILNQASFQPPKRPSRGKGLSNWGRRVQLRSWEEGVERDRGLWERDNQRAVQVVLDKMDAQEDERHTALAHMMSEAVGIANDINTLVVISRRMPWKHPDLPLVKKVQVPTWEVLRVQTRQVMAEKEEASSRNRETQQELADLIQKRETLDLLIQRTKETLTP